jgi:hypothetical protein
MTKESLFAIAVLSPPVRNSESPSPKHLILAWLDESGASIDSPASLTLEAITKVRAALDSKASDLLKDGYPAGSRITMLSHDAIKTYNLQLHKPT